jgi:phosphatidylglycerol:prolipoprotein diacylglycerol transferase
MTYPNIDPVILDLGFAKIYWYGLMYIFAFISAYFLAKNRIKKSSQWKLNELEDLIFYGAIGVVLGGRLGYMFFYNLSDFISNPAIIFEIQNGGMSFHGGLLGVIISMILFNRKYKRDFFITMDFVAPLVPLGLGFGRIGNFINGELWGKVSSSSYAMFIPQENISRYPTQLYEAFLEGLILFAILWLYSSKERPRMSTSALFLIFYGLFRFIIEFVREPDQHIGYLAFNWITMGQVLSFPMILLGVYLFMKSNKNASIS